MFRLRTTPCRAKLLPPVSIVLPLFVLGLAASTGHAATFNIPNGDVAALKTAITTANGNDEADVINLATNGTYTLTAVDNSRFGATGLPVISDDPDGADVMFNGNGATIQRSEANGTPTFRLLAVGAFAEVAFNNVKFSKGAGTATENVSVQGGAIFGSQSATVSVSNCVFSGNTASTGGAIENDRGTFVVSSCVFDGNGALSPDSRDGHGGAITNSLGTMTIRRSSFQSNTAPFAGGAIFNTGYDDPFNTSGTANLSVFDSTFSNNSTTSSNSGVGGAIDNNGGFRGGVANLNLVQCTLSANTANSGGAIINTSFFDGDAKATVLDCTLSGNSATSQGGGIYNVYELGNTNVAALTIGNTILRKGAMGVNIVNENGTVTSRGSNLSDDAASGDSATGPGGLLNAAGDIRNTDPLLGALADNGGPTLTHALLAGSPAANKGNNAILPLDSSDLDGDNNTTEPIPFDQRGTGFPRIIGSLVDIGALESPFTGAALSVLSINNAAAVAEGNSGQANSAQFTVTLAPAATSEVRVSYQTQSGSATEGTDFVRTAGELVFVAGQTTKTISVPIIGDLIAEGDETFTVVLSAPVNATLNPNATTGTGTITDDDVAKLTLSITPSTFSEGAGATAATGTVTRNTPTGAALTVNLSSSNTAKVTVPATVVIPANQTSATFALAAVDNTIVDGSKTVTITASSTGLAAATADVTVTDNDSAPPTNTAPVAQNQSVSTNQDTAKTIVLTATDANNDALTFAIVTQPSNGTLSGSGANVIYTPKAGFSGSDSFTFKANDGKADSNVATITLQVLAAPKPNTPPVAQNQSLRTDKATPLLFALGATDAENDALTFRIVAQPKNGKLSGSAANLTYTPNDDFSGTDTFTFVANDGKVDSNVATITVQVLAGPVENTPPVASPLRLSTRRDAPITLALIATDANIGDKLTYRIVSGPKNGKLSGSAQNLTYTPNAGFSGLDSFTFVANDGQADSNVATVMVQVLENSNTPPVAINQALRAQINTPLIVTLRGTDADGDTLIFRIVTQPKNGKLTAVAGKLNYTPNTGYTGSDSFTFVANDGQADSNIATITLQVLAGGNPPPPTPVPTQKVQAVNDSYNLILGPSELRQNNGVTLLGDGTFRIAPRGVLANDRAVPGKSLSARLKRGPQHGRVQLNADGSFDYQPSAGFAGTDEFTYTLSDGQNSDTARVRLIVLDRRGPELRFDVPGDGSVIPAVSAIRGRVRDRESGVKAMSLLWRRLSDGAFWNGSAWTSSATPLPLTVEGTFWKYEGELPENGTDRESDLLDGEYALRATAVDNIGNTSRLTIQFSVDNGAPEAPELSDVRLSSAGASVEQDAIVLRFTGALDANSATGTMNYAVAINGVETEIGAANTAGNIVTLSSFDLQEGDEIELRIDGLRDASGKALRGGTIQLIAR